MKLLKKPAQPSGGDPYLLYPFRIPSEWRAYLGIEQFSRWSMMVCGEPLKTDCAEG